MIHQFMTEYSKDGMIAVTLQMVAGKFRYIVDDITNKQYVAHPLDEIPVSQDMHDEIVNLSERCWPYYENLWVLKFGFRPLSAELKSLLKSCWHEIFKKEPALNYKLTA